MEWAWFKRLLNTEKCTTVCVRTEDNQHTHQSVHYSLLGAPVGDGTEREGMMKIEMGLWMKRKTAIPLTRPHVEAGPDWNSHGSGGRGASAPPILQRPGEGPTNRKQRPLERCTCCLFGPPPLSHPHPHHVQTPGVPTVANITCQPPILIVQLAVLQLFIYLFIFWFIQIWNFGHPWLCKVTGAVN